MVHPHLKYLTLKKRVNLFATIKAKNQNGKNQ